MVFLITRWFGCFRFNDNGTLDKMILFDENAKHIAKKLILISHNQILSEEKQLVKKDKDILVNQKRLRHIGHYSPNHPLFSQCRLHTDQFSFENDLFLKASTIQATQLIQEQLLSPDLQIIQKMHAIDDLQHTINLFDERMELWRLFSIDPQTSKSFQDLTNQIKIEMKTLQEEVKNEINHLMPNTSILIGPLLTARLLLHAGSMKKLGRLPASSIQLLGAEKALFRFKKEGGKPPKHGILFQHSALLQASRNQKGKIARLLSLKLIIAIRADIYTKRDIGQQLLNDFEVQLKKINKKLKPIKKDK